MTNVGDTVISTITVMLPKPTFLNVNTTEIKLKKKFRSSYQIYKHGLCGVPLKTVVRRLTTGMRSKKCVVRRFHRCANVIQCTYTNLDSIAYYTPMLYGIAYCSLAANLYSMLLY